VFVYDVLTAAGVSPGEPNQTWLHQYPPTAAQWADPNYEIPGWSVLGSNETPAPGDVVAQQFDYGDASGHVMIVGPNGSAIGTSDSGSEETAGIIVDEPEPAILGRPEVGHGAKVYRRWGK
jgi:hypothetical protein